MYFYIELTPEELEKVRRLDAALGMHLWNIAVLIAPIDTGNLRRSITLVSNRSKLIRIRYNLTQANYAKFLEEGLGPVKKYKHFMAIDTRLAMVEAIISYLKTGKKPLYFSAPTVQLRSSNRPFSKERTFLRAAGMRANSITPKARNTISKIRETQYRKRNNIPLSSFTGKKVETVNGNGNAIRGSVRGIGILNQVYKEVKS